MCIDTNTAKRWNPYHVLAFRGMWLVLLVAAVLSLLIQQCAASIGDRLPDFRECVKVRDRDPSKCDPQLI